MAHRRDRQAYKETDKHARVTKQADRELIDCGG